MNQDSLEMKIPGFESVKVFLRYCKINSRTPEASFSKEHAEILYSMIGISLSDYYGYPIPDLIEIPKFEMNGILESIMEKDQDRLYV